MDTLSRIHKRLDTLVPNKYRNKHFSFILVLLGASLDTTNVAGSLSVAQSIKDEFNADSPTVSWTLSAYALTLGAFIMLGGKMADILGAKTVFVTGLMCSAILALICAVIEDQIIVLIVFRALQGIAASVTIPSMFPIAYGYYTGKAAPIALSSTVVMMCISYGFGLVVGGAMSLTNIGYKGLFYYTFATGFAASLILYFTMMPLPPMPTAPQNSMRNLDWPGTFLFIVGTLLVILGLTEGGESWQRPVAYVPLPVGCLVLGFALWFELVYVQKFKDRANARDQEKPIETEDPGRPQTNNDWREDLMLLLPREVFHIPNFLIFIITVALLYMAYIIVLTLEVQYAMYIEHDNALIAGLKTFPVAVGLGIGAVLNKEKLIYKVGMRFVLIGSQIANIGLTVWMQQHDYHQKNNYWIYGIVPMLFFGFLIQTYFVVYINAVMSRTPGHLQGVVAGLLNTCAQVGICLGTALLATILGTLSMPETEEQRAHLNKRFDHGFFLSMGIRGLMVIFLCFLKPQTQSVFVETNDQASAPTQVDVVNLEQAEKDKDEE